jgi:tungstate transport system ATP-binding protein
MHLPFQSGKMRLFGLDAAIVNKLALRRRCSMVFQETMLLNDRVFDNVALALRFRGLAEQEIKQKVNAALAVFHCDHLAQRVAGRLSGGEAQRVCLARALVYQPELLLLDEPFAALDSATRTSLLTDLRQVAIKFGMTVLLISHHFNDVLYFAQRALVLLNGSIVQDGQPEVILRRPVNEAVANLVDMDNIFPCQLEQQSTGCFLRLGSGVSVPWRQDSKVQVTTCCLPGDALHVWEEAYGQESGVIIEGNVSQVIPGIGVYRLIVKAQGLSLTARVPREQVAGKIVVGMNIKLSFNPNELQVM